MHLGLIDTPQWDLCNKTGKDIGTQFSKRLPTHLTLEVTNDNFHGVHCLELYILAFLKNHCIANTGRKNIN